MTPFALTRADSVDDAIAQFEEVGGAAYLAGGTTLVDLLKLGIAHPTRLINLNSMRDQLGGVECSDEGLRIGALATMSEVAGNARVARDYPALVDALRLAASGQLRNMATIGGNLLQQTRCSYFRDRHAGCNKRDPGSGCTALGGVTRPLAVLGGSEHCIANYPGDFAVALVALDAMVEVRTRDGTVRQLPVEGFHRLPADTPHIETELAPGDVITAVIVPPIFWSASLYLKIRDRASYAFALASAAVAIDLDEAGSVRDLRIALGGLAARPWRCRNAETILRGVPISAANAAEAAALALSQATGDTQREFKVALGQRVIVRSLLEANRRAAARLV